MNENALADIQGPVVIACAAPYGIAGMGRHLQELVDFCRDKKRFHTAYLCGGIQNGPTAGTVIAPALMRWLKLYTPLRFSPAWQGFVDSIVFDALAARRLPHGSTFIGFNGQSLRCMKAARQAGFPRVLLIAATPHVNRTVAQAIKAWEYAPVEPIGYIRQQHDRFLFEYEIPDRILHASDYVRQSFLAETFPAAKLERFELTADPRFKPPAMKKRDGRFRVVSVGSLNLIKGTPVLLDAFKKFDAPHVELTLVGGSGTKQMRKYLQACLAQDPRVRIAPGDPLPHLQMADVFVHAAFQDGFAYAAAEAMACGAPVIVTEETGMKERVREGKNGFVVPAGNAAAIAAALHQVRAMAIRA